MKEDEKVFTFYKKSQKGQDLVEYALMLAIIIGIGWGIYSQTGVADSIKNVFGNASSLMETAKKNTGTVDMKAIIARIEKIQTDYFGGGYGMGYKRGLIQSGWLTGDDKDDSTIGSWLPSWVLRCGRITTGRIRIRISATSLKAASCTGPQKKILTQHH